MSPDGGQRRQLTQQEGDDRAGAVYGRWSPDGSRIVFMAGEPSDRKDIRPNTSLFVISAEGGDAQRLSVGLGDDKPDWSADGRWIAFKRHAGAGIDLFVMRPDGSDVTRLTIDGVDKNWARWRP